MRKRSIRLVILTFLVSSLFATSLGGSAQEHQYQEFATDEFETVWERTDRPVAETRVARTWIWGPGANTGLLQEKYTEADDGYRDVQYTDKSRMEMPWNAVDPESEWMITQGRLAYELMTGRLQIGDATFEQYTPAEIPVAGDPDDISGPTYAAMSEYMEWDARPTGGTITQVMDRQGQITDNGDLAAYEVTDAHFDEVTEHNIASVFWDFMNSTGLVYEDGEYAEDALFENPYYAVGRPLTEAYWGWVKVDDVEQNVLIQCFERRCLTYTPDNPEGWEVESGNIGRHYHEWRYHRIPGQRVLQVSMQLEPWVADAVVDPTREGVDLALLVNDHEDRYVVTTARLIDQYGNRFRIADEEIEFSVSAADDDTSIRGGDGYNESEPRFSGGQAEKPVVVATDSDGEVTLYFRRSFGQEVGLASGLINLTATVESTGTSDTKTLQIIEGEDVDRCPRDDDHHHDDDDHHHDNGC